MGWGVECHGRGNMGEGPGPQERQTGEGRWTAIGKSLCLSLCTHFCRLSEVRTALVQAMGSEKPHAHLEETGQFLCRLPLARQLLCGLRASGG